MLSMQFSEQLKRFGNPVAIGRHTENLLEESQDALSHFLQDNLADLLPLVEVRTKVEMGLPYKNIVERAREDGADMVSQVIETGLGPFPQLHSDSLG